MNGLLIVTTLSVSSLMSTCRRNILKVIFFSLLSVSVLYAQELSKDYQQSRYSKQMPGQSRSLIDALTVLGEAYNINFVYEYEFVQGKECEFFPGTLTGDFYADLETVLSKHPLQYIKIGATTIALIQKDANSSRTLKGRIVDNQGLPLSYASVYIDGTSLGASSDRDGFYNIPKLPEGKYTIIAKYIGYRSERFSLSVSGSENITINFTLHPDALNMDEIVVIASRNKLRKIESSVAVTTASIDQINEQAPRSTADIFKAIPGFYVESSGGVSGNNLFPRGIPQDGGYRYIAMYEDGLPIFEAPELVFANIDILMRTDETLASMEGMRGGTGSIYASNAPGGIINFISKTGENEFGGIVKLSLAEYGHNRFDFNLGGPLSTSWNFNIGGFYRYDDGIRSPEFIANKGGQIKANLTRSFKKGYMRFYAKYLNDRNIFFLPIPLQNRQNPTGIPGINANYGTLTSIYQDNVSLPTPDGRFLERRISDGIHSETISFTNEIAFDLGNNWSVRNTSRYMQADIGFNAIFPLENPVSAQFFADSIKQVGDLPEFNNWSYRFSDTGERVNNIASLNDNGLVARSGWWSIEKPLNNFINLLQIKKQIGSHKIDASGYFSIYNAGDFWYWQNILTEVTDAPRMLDLVVQNSQGEDIQSITHNGFEQYGTFYVNAESEASVSALALVDEWKVNNSFRLDIGMRYEHSTFKGTVENTDNDFVIGDGGTPAQVGAIYGNKTNSFYRHTYDEWAFSLGGNLNITHDLAVYGRMGRGFRTPDFEQWIFSKERGSSQYVQQLEGGIKLSSGRFALFGTGFFSRLDNIPFDNEVYQDNQIIKKVRFANSTTIGTELEAIWTLTNQLQLNLTGTIQDPRLRDYKIDTIDPITTETNTIILSKNRVRRIPALLLNFRPVYSMGAIRLYGNWQYVGARFVDDANSSKLPAYSLFNAGMNFKLFSNSIDITANVSNVTNTVGLTEGNPRSEQVVAGRESDVFLARPVLGRTINLGAAYMF